MASMTLGKLIIGILITDAMTMTKKTRTTINFQLDGFVHDITLDLMDFFMGQYVRDRK